QKGSVVKKEELSINLNKISPSRRFQKSAREFFESPTRKSSERTISSEGTTSSEKRSSIPDSKQSLRKSATEINSKQPSDVRQSTRSNIRSSIPSIRSSIPSIRKSVNIQHK